MEISDEESERIIRFSGIKMIRFFLPVIILTALGMFMNPQAWRNAPEWVYWVFLAATVVAGYQSLVCPRSFYLRLSPEGLLIHRMTKETIYCWNEVRSFRIVNGPGITGIRIVWNLTDDSPHRSGLIRTTGVLLGHDASLLDTFQLPAGELVELLNDWQRRFGQQST